MKKNIPQTHAPLHAAGRQVGRQRRRGATLNDTHLPYERETPVVSNSTNCAGMSRLGQRQPRGWPAAARAARSGSMKTVLVAQLRPWPCGTRSLLMPAVVTTDRHADARARVPSDPGRTLCEGRGGTAVVWCRRRRMARWPSASRVVDDTRRQHSEWLRCSSKDVPAALGHTGAGSQAMPLSANTAWALRALVAHEA